MIDGVVVVGAINGGAAVVVAAGACGVGEAFGAGPDVCLVGSG